MCLLSPPLYSPPSHCFVLQQWDGFGAYVTARLPQLERLDGKEITRANRIRAQQRFPSLEKEVAVLAEEVSAVSGSNMFAARRVSLSL